MNDFFIDCSIKLGVTQAEFENGYYIADLLSVMERHNKTEAERLLTQLNIGTAEHMQKEDFSKFVGALREQAGYNEKDGGEKLDKGGLNSLRGKLGN